MVGGKGVSDDEFLAQEYLHVNKVVEDFDTKALTVKAWSITFSAAAIGFSYDKGEWEILLVSAVSAVAFWIVEALVKVNQQPYYRRIGEIEAHFGGGESRKPFQIKGAWLSQFNLDGRYKRAYAILRWPHVFMPHAPIAALALILLATSPPRKAVGPSGVQAKIASGALKPAAK